MCARTLGHMLHSHERANAQELSLACNPLTSSGAGNLMPGLRANHTLCLLDMYKCSISSKEGLVSIMQGLAANKVRAWLQHQAAGRWDVCMCAELVDILQGMASNKVRAWLQHQAAGRWGVCVIVQSWLISCRSWSAATWAGA